MTTHLVVSCYVDTFQVNEEILLPDSLTLFGTFNYPGDANNNRFRFAHESAKRALGVHTADTRRYKPILRQGTHQAILVYNVRA